MIFIVYVGSESSVATATVCLALRRLPVVSLPVQFTNVASLLALLVEVQQWPILGYIVDTLFLYILSNYSISPHPKH